MNRFKAKNIPSFDHSRFLSKIDASDGCWKWKGSFSGGYGVMFMMGSTYQAHRLSYSIFKGDMDENLVIDHKCKNTSCVNPEHLREVTHTANTTVNSDGVCAENKIKTHCKYGHEFTEKNTYIKKNGRECRVCMRNYKRKPKVA